MTASRPASIIWNWPHHHPGSHYPDIPITFQAFSPRLSYLLQVLIRARVAFSRLTSLEALNGAIMDAGIDWLYLLLTRAEAAGR